jgi:hypothetical protein
LTMAGAKSPAASTPRRDKSGMAEPSPVTAKK